MRKTALFIATALLTATLTACSGNGGTSATTSNTASNAEQQTATASTAKDDGEDQNAGQASPLLLQKMTGKTRTRARPLPLKAASMLIRAF